MIVYNYENVQHVQDPKPWRFDLRVTGSILPVVGCEDFGDLPFGGILLVRRLDFGTSSTVSHGQTK